MGKRLSSRDAGNEKREIRFVVEARALYVCSGSERIAFLALGFLNIAMFRGELREIFFSM